MNKKVVLLMAAMALLTFSCTNNEMENQDNPSREAISLNPSTVSSRASITDLDVLENDPNGFAVYAVTNGALEWYNDGTNGIDGTNHHVFENGGWQFSLPVLWPISDYPMTFMAYYPAVSGVITDVNTDYSPDMILDIDIPTDKSLQEDVLVAINSTLSEKPNDGQLNLNFKHILSKVNFTISTSVAGVQESSNTVYILAVGFKNLYSYGQYQLSVGTFDNAGSKRDYDYYNAFEGLSDPNEYQECSFTDADNEPIFPDAVGNMEHLILLPQTPDAWDIDFSLVPDRDNDAYIRVMYRVESATNPVGYADASNHPGYSGSAAENADYTGPLYVLAAYAFDTTWEPGNSYTYDIPIPGYTGGCLLENFYYDDQGNLTDLAVQ